MKTTTTEETQMERYQAQQVGRTWNVIDTETGETVDYGSTRKGLSLQSREIRALGRARQFNENAQDDRLVFLPQTGGWHRRAWLPESHAEYRKES